VDFITSPTAICDRSAEARHRNARIGFVPTMGALHDGHLALVRQGLSECDMVVCSIFVNPLQFNNADDLERYPRQLEVDRSALSEAGCHVLFAPDRKDIFAGFEPRKYDLGGLDQHWEGPSRPGHFQGVVNVVERLFHYVRPDRAYFGEKDRQQLTILRHIGRTERWAEMIVACPTLRASDGLALSSRNARLNEEERKCATALYKALRTSADLAFKEPVSEVIERALTTLATEPSVTVDHFGIADAENLVPLTEWGDRTEAVALVAAKVGPVRLIDNITLNR
jgi:pantoate--beta-alanine ligase